FSLLLSSMGSVFTLSWFLVNRGSKYWQENWENHLDLRKVRTSS
ncbi:RipA family octameric membrane protein, partial [Klebsiella michiganensis]